MSCNPVMQIAGHRCTPPAAAVGSGVRLSDLAAAAGRWRRETAAPQLSAAGERPDRALVGALKQVLNDAAALGDLGLQGANLAGYGMNQGAAGLVGLAGFEETAARYHQRNDATFARLSGVALPRAGLAGEAERGGALVMQGLEAATAARSVAHLAETGLTRMRTGLRGAADAPVPPRTSALPEAAPVAAQATTIGRNRVEWLKDAQGRLVGARAVLREVFSGLDRSPAERAAQRATGKRGIEGDHGGHIIDHRFTGDQGPVNMFPQNGVPLGALKNFNGSAYRTMMNELSDWVKAGAEVRLDVRLGKLDDNGRPGVVKTQYSVVEPADGRLVYHNQARFENAPGQVFDRLNAAEIRTRMQSLAGALDDQR